MLTVICPNCRHGFPVSGCCSGNNSDVTTNTTTTTTTTVISFDQQQQAPIVPAPLPTSISIGHSSGGGMLLVDAPPAQFQQPMVTISTQCGIQSGGCLIQSSNAEVMLQHGNAGRLELRSKMSGGGCLVQKRIEPDYYHHESSDSKEAAQGRPLLISEEQLRSSFEQAAEFHRSHSTTARLDPPPSGCQELPGTRRELPAFTSTSFPQQPSNNQQQQQAQASSSPECRCCCFHRCCYTYSRNSSSAAGTGNSPPRPCCAEGKNCPRSSDTAASEISYPPPSAPQQSGSIDAPQYAGDVRIQVNATVHLPCTSSTTVSSCTFNITASTSGSSTPTSNSDPSSNISSNVNVNRLRNNFNGGGIVTIDNSTPSNSESSNASSVGSNVSVIGSVANNNAVNNNREDMPGTPISWMALCPWAFEQNHLPEKDMAKLADVRKTLQSCGWYHEGLSWQQSENLLKDAPIGRWLLRDSSDSRYTFAISVQTARGPTSVRVFYFLGKFRLDAEPRLASTMPLFETPIKMLEYYCEYSKRMDEHRQEVWVDYSGQVYSQIYLSEPLVKEVRSLSHLARIAVNKAGGSIKKEREKLPPLIKNYLKEYPYTL
ncbi:uncharacterized protein LOC100677965 [Nasonia vitripennis]|uniref:Suppressor of cytokine signaling 2 n=1 Tax=Nasonia vitripennis TaxID=7425 RepID=A0A7M7HBM7_NASVI|nr:uncharacterized protein LOC100677965 [Nasonia vitripennis]XP_008213835.1 uncharacterized protein LOC100677965 [Nasonia vitripennis]XP_031778211.1 uncharacterized protein LOC100677965 [Nasonia vitripennis]